MTNTHPSTARVKCTVHHMGCTRRANKEAFNMSILKLVRAMTPREAEREKTYFELNMEIQLIRARMLLPHDHITVIEGARMYEDVTKRHPRQHRHWDTLPDTYRRWVDAAVKVQSHDNGR